MSLERRRGEGCKEWNTEEDTNEVTSLFIDFAKAKSDGKISWACLSCSCINSHNTHGGSARANCSIKKKKWRSVLTLSLFRTAVADITLLHLLGEGGEKGTRERESDIDRSINSYILYGWSEVCGCGSSFVAFFCRFFILSHRFDATFILKKAKALARSTHFKRFYLCYLQSMCIESQVASSHSVPKEDEAEIGENKFFFAPIILYCDTIFRYLFQQRRWTFPIFAYTLRKRTESPYWDTSNEKKERRERDRITETYLYRYKYSSPSNTHQ